MVCVCLCVCVFSVQFTYHDSDFYYAGSSVPPWVSWQMKWKKMVKNKWHNCQLHVIWLCWLDSDSYSVFTLFLIWILPSPACQQCTREEYREKRISWPCSSWKPGSEPQSTAFKHTIPVSHLNHCLRACIVSCMRLYAKTQDQCWMGIKRRDAV